MFALAVILTIGFVLRIYQLDGTSLWFDEAFSLKTAQFSTAELVLRTSHDTQPPLYYVMLKVWISAFGETPMAMRAMSVAWGMLAIVGTFLFVYEAYGCLPPNVAMRAALLCTAFVALSPFQILWSQMARMYAPFSALAVISSWLLFRAMRHDGRRKLAWTIYTASAMFLLFVHYFSLMVLAAQYVVAIGHGYFRARQCSLGAWRAMRPALFSFLGLSLFWLLWMPTFLDQQDRVRESFGTSPFVWGMFANTFTWLMTARLWEVPSPTTGWIVFQVCVIGMLALALCRRPADLYMATVLFLSMTVAISYSVAARNLMVPRYFAAFQLFVAIAAGVLLARVRPAWLRIAAVSFGMAGMLLLTSWYVEWRSAAAQLPGMSKAMAEFDERRNPEESLVAVNPMLYMPALSYTRNAADLRVIGTKEGYPFFHGTAVMNNDEFVTVRELSDYPCDWMWTLDAEKWHGHSWEVALPPEWRPLGESRFADYYGVLVLRLHQRSPP
jgi:mannosyltransferase